MTEQTTPADELRAAADKLRTLAAAVPPQPWTDDGIGDYGFTVAMGQFGLNSNGFVLDTRDDSEQGRSLAAYIAVMHPGVGAALAELLDTAAEYLADDAIAHPTHLVRALAVARKINGGQP